MTLITKRDTCVGIAKEGSRGTKVAPTFWVPLKSLDFEDKNEKVIDDSGYGVIEDSVEDTVVKQWAEGSLGGNIYSESFGLILFALLGAKAVSGDATGYVHAITVAQSHQHQSLTVSLDDGLNELAYPLAMINSLEITAEVGGFAEYTADFYSKVSESAGTLTPSYSTGEKSFTAKDATLKIADDLSGLAGASAICVKSVNLSVEKNLEPDDCLGSDDPNDILNKSMVVTGEIELLYEANTYKALAQAGTNKALRIALTSASVIGAGSTPYSLTIDLAKVSLDWSKATGDDLTRQTLSFKALYSLSDSSMITASLVNATASY